MPEEAAAGKHHSKQHTLSDIRKNKQKGGCKLQKPTIDVITVLDIVDNTTKIKNEICSKLSKNISDRPGLVPRQTYVNLAAMLQKNLCLLKVTTSVART